METIGYQLRAARARKNCALEEAARATKIKPDKLAAFEADNFSQGVAPIYTKAFLKTYADFLGLDGRAVAEQFSQQLGGISHHLPIVQPAPDSDAAANGVFQITPQILGGGLFVLLLLLGMIFWGWQHHRVPALSARPQPTPGTERTTPSASVSTVPRSATRPPREYFATSHFGNDMVPLPSSSGAEVLHVLTIRAEQTCAVRVTADSKKAFDGSLRPGEQREFAAKKFHLSVADAGGVTIWLDGQRQPRWGREGELAERELPVPQSLNASGR